MRLIAIAAVLAASFASSSAFAQYQHHTFCLKQSGSSECAYDSMAQCNAARQGGNGECVPNSAPVNH